MFDINNNELIKRIICQRSDDEVVIPLYVKIYNDTYPILEIDNITQYNPTAFKIGFGTAHSMFMKNYFPPDRVREFDVVKSFDEFDNDSNCYVRYIVFESSYMNDDDNMGVISDQINNFMDILGKYISEKTEQHRKKMLEDNL